MDPEQLLGALSLELEKNLTLLAEASTPEEKKIYSEIILNLAKSLGVFFQAATDMMDLDLDDFDDEDDF